jgi:uncharacterized protein DUF885
MRYLSILLCALLSGPTLRATPGNDLTTRGKALLANKEKLSHADRLHRLFDISWEYIEVEVDRYIVWPSQALGYKIGQLKIRELRQHAEKELGQKFDLRAFHDEVLKNGALPMSVLGIHLKEWVAKAKNA